MKMKYTDYLNFKRYGYTIAMQPEMKLKNSQLQGLPLKVFTFQTLN